MLIDTNVNLGSWPFTFALNRSAAQLTKHLAASGVTHAIVSHFGAAFQPDPMPSNRELLAATKKSNALTALPVINLRLANWRDQLAECVAAKVSAIKLLPTYNNYSLRDKVVGEFMTALNETKLRLVINMRYEDERHRYFALDMKGLPLADLKPFLKRNPKTHMLLAGAMIPEVRELSAKFKNFSIELSYCEWINSVEDLVKLLTAKRIMLGTCTPLLSTRGEVDKLRFSKITPKAMEQISSTNAQQFFNL